jgi:hypothetical protein
VSIPAWGYEFGISHLPLDITLAQAELIAELCFIDLKNRADRICGSHALLYFRVLVADVVLQEHNLYGKVERWGKENTEEKAAHWIDREIDDTRIRIGNVTALLQCMDEILGDPNLTEEVWRKQHNVLLPNAAGLYRAVKKRRMDLLRIGPGFQDAGNLITVEAFRNNLKKYFSESRIDELRAEAHDLSRDLEI